MSASNNQLNRREFMGLLGGSCAVIGAASIVPATALAQRPEGPPSGGGMGISSKKTKDAKAGPLKQISTDVLVVGGGMAGVFAAVKAHDNGAKVIMVDKGSVGRSGQTPFARGIFRFDENVADRDEFLRKTNKAAEYVNNAVYTGLMLDHSGECVDELDSWGFFDEACYDKSFLRALNERKIDIYERVMLTNLLKKDGRVVGAAGLFIDRSETLVIHAKSVILCTGASGFKPSGWQIGSLTSDGDAMAYRIGAEITGKEWVDGHSRTNYGLNGLNHIVIGNSSTSMHGMLGVEENIEVSKNGPSSGGMMMGPPPGGGDSKGGPGGPPPSGGKGEKGDRRGPPSGEGETGGTVAGMTPGGHGGPPPSGGKGGHGGPPGGAGGGSGPTMMGGASAGMSQHKAEGLFPADGRCASNIPGLYAAGDALGSMQSGGIYTQVGSSLAGSAVQGAVAGKAAAEFSSKATLLKTDEGSLKKINTEIYAPLLRDQGFSPQWLTQTMQGVMIPNFILYVKSEKRILAALTYLEYMRDHQVPLLMADDLHELRQCHEITNMILNAEMKLRASLMRKESRASHYREDYPERNDEEWIAWIKIKRGKNDEMELVKHPCPRNPVPPKSEAI